MTQLRQRPVRVQHRDLLQPLQLRGQQLQPPGRRSLTFVELVEPVVQVAECDQRGAAERPAPDQQDVLRIGATLDDHGDDGQTQADHADDHGGEALAQRKRDEHKRHEVQPGDRVPGNDEIENERRGDAGYGQRDHQIVVGAQPHDATQHPWGSTAPFGACVRPRPSDEVTALLVGPSPGVLVPWPVMAPAPAPQVDHTLRRWSGPQAAFRRGRAPRPRRAGALRRAGEPGIRS